MFSRFIRRSFSTGINNGFAGADLAGPGTKYGQRYLITLIPGDGTGKELTGSIKEVFKAVNAPVDWEEVAMTGYADTDEGSKLPQALESIRRNKIALKGRDQYIIHIGSNGKL